MNIFKLEFKSQLHSLILWVGITSLLLIFFMAFFPSMKTESMKVLVGAKLDALPPAVLAIMGISELPDFTNITNYFCYTLQYINMAVAIFAALLGTSSLIKEESDGTIEYLYAQPVTRYDIVKYKMLANISAFAIFTLILGIVSAVLFKLFGGENQDFFQLYGNIKTIFIGLFFAGIVFMSVGFLASTLLSNLKQSASFSLGIVFGTFIIGSFSALIKELDFLKYVSPLDITKPNKLVADGFDMVGVAVGLFVIAASVILCFIVYRKKDLKCS